MTYLHLITSCTDRKRGRVPDELRVRDLAAGSTVDRANQWIARLAAPCAIETPASEVYVGEHWSVVRRHPAMATPTASSVVTSTAGAVHPRSTDPGRRHGSPVPRR